MKLEYTYDFGLAGEKDLLVGVDYTPADKGRIYGEPENCYPPTDAEIVVYSVTLCGHDLTWLLAHVLEEYDDFRITVMEALEEEAFIYAERKLAALKERLAA